MSHSLRSPVHVLLLLSTALLPLAACDSCGCHLPSDTGATTVDSGWSVGLFEQYTDFSTLKDNGHTIDNPADQWMRSSITQIIIGYRLSETISAHLYVPYIRRTYQRPSFGDNETGTEKGLGDTSLITAFRVLRIVDNGASATVSLLAGLKAPTGDASQLGVSEDDLDPETVVAGHDLALGTGSWDGIVGVNTGAEWDRWFVLAQATYTFRSIGAYDYRTANEIAASASLGTTLWQADHRRLTIQANALGESKGYDQLAGEDQTDTANHNLFLGPEADLHWGSSMGSLALDLPVIENNSETQLVPTWRLRAAFTWLF